MGIQAEKGLNKLAIFRAEGQFHVLRIAAVSSYKARLKWCRYASLLTVRTSSPVFVKILSRALAKFSLATNM